MSNNPGFRHTFNDLYEASDGKEYNWSNGLFSGWLENIPTCLGSVCCFPCSRGYLTTKAGGKFWPSCLMNTFGCGFGDCSHNIEMNELGVTTEMVKKDFRDRKSPATSSSSPSPAQGSAVAAPPQSAPVQKEMSGN
ncbi:hypothetical protein FOZ60_008008 [Perkinsus olseni]|uniref:Uncharacterized protein n=1 Tax=Perkinsus olseni TaxID=32597 RepID=A0A7J6NKX0_PEROL|nr:hypothetical protein FOZ60_008008 [Perkinsus olseni]